MNRLWYFSFDAAPDFIVKLDGNRVHVQAERKPSGIERGDWVEATWMRASHHMSDGQLREFGILNELMEKIGGEE